MKHESLKSLDFDSIKHVGNATWYLIWDKYKILTIAIVIITIVVFVIVLHPIVFAIFVVYYSYLHWISHKWFMREFAKVNNMEYRDGLLHRELKGNLFKIGSNRNANHVIETSYKGHPMKLFNYSYQIGSDKHKSTHRFTVTEIFFDKVEFPHILLQSRTMWRYGAKDKNQKKLSLEEEFKKDYYLYSIDGYEVEVFQIFTPEVLRFLKEKGAHFSIEFAENRLYIYDDLTISNKKDLQNMYEVTKKIFDSIGPLLNRLNDDFAVLHPYYKK